MEQLDFEEVQKWLSPDEGELWQYYGKPKNGKTYGATKDALNDLLRGQTVVANWKIKWEGYDERQDWFCLILGLLGLKKTFINIPKSNFVFLDPTDPKVPERISMLTDCTIYLDEGQRYYDSYVLTKMDPGIRMSLALTAHFNRRIIVVSQRAMAIHVSLRGNVNRFFKFEKIFKGFWFIPARFKRTEYLEMVGENVDETKEESVEVYWGKKKIYNAYDFKFMRGDTPRSQPNWSEIFFLKWSEVKQILKQKIWTKKKKDI